MFRTLIYPSSGACDCIVELPHRSSCSEVRSPYSDALCVDWSEIQTPFFQTSFARIFAVLEAVWVAKPVWTGVENLASNGV